MIVREITKDDFKEVENMFVDLYKHLNEKGFILTLNEKTLNETLTLQLNSKFMKIFVVEEKSTKNICGFTNLSILKLNSKFICGDEKFMGNITEFFVKKEYRKKGCSKKLMDKAEEFFKQNKISIVNVNTMVDNLNAINFYKKSGFTEDYISFIKNI